jgi:next-to-BRCA1 protein 1
MTLNNKVHHRFNPNWVLTAMDKGASHSTELHASEYNDDSTQHWIIEYVGTSKHNVETGEKGDKSNRGQNLFDNILMAPSRPCKQRVKGYYAQLAREMGRHHSCGRIKSCHTRMRKQEQCNESGETARIDSAEEDSPPAWFFNYMDKFKAEITNEISKLVARKTVRQVLRGLEGAVVTSVHGTSGLPVAPSTSGLSAIGHPSTADGQRNMYCHYGVVCDNCDQTIVGARFKCGNCEDFDLCEQCENIEGIHDPDHVFIKIRRPTITAGRRKNGKLSPLLKKSLYTTEEDRKRMEEKAKKEEKKLLEKKKKIERMERKEEHREEKQRRREEKLKRRLVEQRECPMKKERLDLPQFQTTERMDAQFIKDANIPDSTHVQPCTRLTKRWVMKNTGTHCWTSSTKLKLMWGNIACVADEVTVPYLEPGHEGTLAVELIAPDEPGFYQSHWRLYHHGTRFGHRVWCSIVVDPREVLEPDQAEPRSLLEIKNVQEVQQKVGEPSACNGVGPDAAAAVAQLKSPTQDQTTKVVDADILTAQDILSFEMLDIRDRNTPEVSQTATPNNTPLAVSPPKSPAPELEEDTPQLISSSSSVELVSEASCEDISAQMTELVQERIAALGLKHEGTDDDDDIETLSSCSSEDIDTDSDFYIVPLPDCFNPNLPPSTAASTNVVIPKEAKDKSLDEILTASNSIETEPLIPSVKHTEVTITTIQCSEPEVSISEEPEEEDDTKFEDAEAAREDACIVIPEEEETEADIPTGADEDTVTDHNANVQPAQDGEVDQAEPVLPARPQLNRQQSPSPGEIAQSVLTTAIGVASHAAASAYSTAKDVFKTLQAKEQYVPPKSEWTPPNQDWTLPKQQWTPASQDWTPPNIKWTPPKTTWTPPDESEVVRLDEPSTPMEQLIEMGFGNREQNKALLEKFEGDVSKVIQELIQMQDDDWHKNRH